MNFLYDKIEPTAVCIPLTTGNACPHITLPIRRGSSTRLCVQNIGLHGQESSTGSSHIHLAVSLTNILTI